MEPTQPGAPARTEIPLPALTQERLGRLRAEWQLAVARADLARERLEGAAAAACRDAGVTGRFQIDFERGVLSVEKE